MTLLYSKILHSAGHDCTIGIWMNKGRGFQLEPFMPKDINFKVLRCPQILLAWKYALLIRRESPDIVFSSLPLSSKIILQLKAYGIIHNKIVIRHFNMPSKHSKRSLKTLKKTLNYFKHANAIISQTDEMKDEMIKYFNLPAEQITIIHNPIDKSLIFDKINDQSSIDHHYTNYLGVGRIARQKDFKTMIKAFGIVCQQEPNSRLYIVGGYEQNQIKKDLDELITKLDLSEKVFFEGLQSNPFKYMNDCNVFLLSSIFEGLPNAMLEAMYIGKPVVATESIPFIGQVIKDGINGYTVPVGDYEQFAKRMLDATKLNIVEKFVDVTNSEDKIIRLFESLK